MTESTAPGAERRQIRHERFTLLCVCGATLMLLIDVTIVQVALPQIQEKLHASFSDQEWVISGYALTLSAVLLMMGALADRFGRKLIFCLGVVAFSLASLACGLATNATALILSRGAQGIGGAAMFATALALIGQEFHGPARGRAIAAWGATIGAAVAIGPLAGGVLTSAFGWRWIFFVNVPIGLIVVVIAIREIRNISDPEATHLDPAGLVSFSAILALLVLALVRGKDDGFTTRPILILFGISVVLLVAFIAIERRQTRPMLDLSLFRSPSFLGVSFATFCVSAGSFAAFPYLTFYLQNYLGYSPLQGGLRLIPVTIPAFVVPLVTRSLVERIAPRVTLGGGLALCAIGLFMMRGIGIETGWTEILPGSIVIGVGIGFANPAIARIALGVVAPQRAGMASGISNTFRTGGLAVGVATLGAIFQGSMASSLRASGYPASLALTHPPSVEAAAAGLSAGGLRTWPGVNPLTALHRLSALGSVPPALFHNIVTPLNAFISGVHAILLIGAIAVGVGVALSGLVRQKDFHPVGAAPAEAQPATVEVS